MGSSGALHFYRVGHSAAGGYGDGGLSMPSVSALGSSESSIPPPRPPAGGPAPPIRPPLPPDDGAIAPPVRPPLPPSGLPRPPDRPPLPPQDATVAPPTRPPMPPTPFWKPFSESIPLSECVVARRGLRFVGDTSYWSGLLMLLSLVKSLPLDSVSECVASRRGLRFLEHVFGVAREQPRKRCWRNP